MNKFEWAFSTILTSAILLITIKVTDPGLLNHITEPQIAAITGISIALIQFIKQTTRMER